MKTKTSKTQKRGLNQDLKPLSIPGCPISRHNKDPTPLKTMGECNGVSDACEFVGPMIF
jgi:hypothetical protein